MDANTRTSLTALQDALSTHADLGDSALDALTAIADAADAVRPRVHAGDPYADLVLALAPGGAELEVASRVTGLRAYETDWWPHLRFYVDPVADPSGHHRVYVRDEEQFPGVPRATLPSIAALADAWTCAAAGDRPDLVDTINDDWESSPASGGFVFETLVRGSVSSQWAVAGLGAFVPRRPEAADDALPVEEGEHPRVLCLHALRVLRLAGDFTLPEHIDAPELPAAHRAYLDHLRELQLAFSGEVPPLVRAVTATPGPHRAAARAWAKRFAEAREAEPEPDFELPEPAELTPFEKKLRSSVDAALNKLVADGDIEVLNHGMLLDELTRIAEKARSPKHLVRKMATALVHSEAVDEIYVSDDDLEAAFLAKLER